MQPGPTIDHVTPSQGSTTGGQPILITGRGFQAGAVVTIAAVPAEHVNVLSPQQIVAKVPLHLNMRGRQRIQVQNSDGRIGHADDLFSYYPGVMRFNPGPDQPSGSTPVAMSAVDLNGDGMSDLIVGYQTSGLKVPGPTVSVLLAQKGGQFQLAGELPAPAGLYGMQVADVNGDGEADVVSANSTNNSVSVWLNQGQGKLAPRTDYPVGTHPVSVAVADFDRGGGSNGKMDIIAANADDGTATLLSAQPPGYLKTPVVLPETAWAIAAGDVDGDGQSDLVYTAYSNRVVRVMLGKGDGSFTSVTSYSTEASPVALALADLDGDKRLDVVVANSGSDTVSVYLGVGDGRLRFRGSSYVGDQPKSVSILDVNLDGIPDLVVPCGGSQSVSVLLGGGDGSFLEAQLYPAGGDLSVGAVGTMSSSGELLDFMVMGNSALRVLQNLSE